MTPLTIALSLGGTLGCGLVAGVFFAFSTFVMRALERRPAPEAIAAMQSINVAVLNPWFLGVFVGTALVCAGASAAAQTRAVPTNTPRNHGFSTATLIDCIAAIADRKSVV